MVFSVVSLLFLAAGPGVPPEIGLVTPDEAVASLRACGFSDVSTHYQDDLQDNVIEIADASATDGQVECAARVYLASGYWTEVPEAFRSRYFEHYGRMSAEWARQRSLRELDERGELDLLPAYDAGTTNDAEFARKLEDLCGERAEGMLQSEYGPHVVSPEWALDRRNSYDQIGEALSCVMRFSAAAGFTLGLIGNEKAAEPSGGQ